MNIIKITTDMILARQKELRTTLNGAGVVDKAVTVLADHLQREPQQYVAFGAYWWAVKDVLRRHGTDFGEADDEVVRADYIAKDDETVLIAAQIYKEAFYSHYFAQNRAFTLSDGRAYTLYDADMEMLVLLKNI